MKYLLLFFIVSNCMITVIQGQTLKPNVIAAGGGYSTGSSGSLSWTMGETFTTTLQAGGNVLTQGFQQPLSTVFYQDNDHDGYGNVNVTIQAITAPPGYVADFSDCDDNNAAIHPGAVEICNGIDDNCNGIVDEGAVPPATPGLITGLTNVCPYINAGTQLTYSIDAIPNAAGYLWTVPATVSIVSGQGTNSITITIGSGFASIANKVIKVKATSTCGNSADKLFYLLAQYPNTPAAITASSTNICAAIGNASPISFTIPKTIAASSYIWTAQNGTTTITHPNGTGVNDTTISVIFNSGFTTSTITVQSVNDCGTGGVRSFTLTRNNPAAPSLIIGPTNVCENIGATGVAATYSVTAASNTIYNWTVPANATGLTGQGTNSISFTYPQGFTTGTITVTATNGCGTGAVRTLAVSKLNPTTPGVIDIIQTGFCPGRTYSYTLATMPSQATSVLWTIPANATVVSGQGTTSIMVSYPDAAVVGTVTATAINNCGTSSTRTTQVKLPACPPPGFAKNNGKETGVIAKSTASVTGTNIIVSPNPTFSSFRLIIKSPTERSMRAVIKDASGRLVSTLNVSSNEFIEFGSNLKAGIYLLEIDLGGAIKTERIVKL